jgi:hypothetical protein
MNTQKRFLMVVVLGIAVGLVLAGPVFAKKDSKTFLGSDDAKESDEPQKYLPDYAKLVAGVDADWVYLPEGSLKKYKKVYVKEFVSNARETYRIDAKNAAEYGQGYLRQWLDQAKFEIVESAGAADMIIEGNVFSAWEPSGGARFFGGWMANPGCGQEIIIHDSKGGLLGFMRHKSRGSTIRDAIENGLDEMVKSIASGK